MTDITPSCPSGVYAITHTASGRQYVGSSVDIAKRWRQHRTTLNCKRHRSRFLERMWHKYGADAFSFTVLEYVPDVTRLLEREQFYLDTLKPVFNTNPQASSRLGAKFSPESLARLSASHKGLSLPLEQRAKIGAALKGRKQSPEMIAKRTAKLRGRKRTPEQIARMTEANRAHGLKRRGRPVAPEMRERIRAKLMGQKHTPERRAKQRAAKLGKKQSPDMIAKRAAGIRRYWANKRGATQLPLWRD